MAERGRDRRAGQGSRSGRSPCSLPAAQLCAFAAGPGALPGGTGRAQPAPGGTQAPLRWGGGAGEGKRPPRSRAARGRIPAAVYPCGVVPSAAPALRFCARTPGLGVGRPGLEALLRPVCLSPIAENYFLPAKPASWR